MRLELGTYKVRQVCFSQTTGLKDGVLAVSREELETYLCQDKRFKRVTVDLVSPGDDVRLVHILDIIEPRTKVEGGSIFPGFLGPPRQVGWGRTHRLDGVAVVETAEMPLVERGLLVAREQLIDMSGFCADYSPFSKTFNVVLGFEPEDGISLEDYDQAIRLAGLKTAWYLADTSKGLEPDIINTYQLGEVDKALPRIIYICQVSSTGPLAFTFLYGEQMGLMVPTFIHPNELIDGAIVSGYYLEPVIPTFVHCNNPVVRELYQRHGQDLNFLGVIITTGGGVTPTSFLKERSANYAAKLAKWLRADGAILTQEGGGNAILDQMWTCQFCEELGIKTSVISYEMSGEGGLDVPLIFMVPEADAVISTGNREKRVVLPKVAKVLGGEKILYTDFDASQGYPVPVVYFYSSVDQTGFWRMTTEEY